MIFIPVIFFSVQSKEANCVNNATCAVPSMWIQMWGWLEWDRDGKVKLGGVTKELSFGTTAWQNYDFTYKKTLKFNIKWHVIWDETRRNRTKLRQHTWLTACQDHMRIHAVMSFPSFVSV